MAEHDSEGEATIYVIRGRVRLSTEDAHWDGMGGDLIELPSSRHRLDALEDSAILLSVAKTGASDSPGDHE